MKSARARRAIRGLLLAGLAACSTKPPGPTIVSFTVDNPAPAANTAVTFTFVTKNATAFELDPLPGQVTASPVSVLPPAEPTTFVLTAYNGFGSATAQVVVTPQQSLAVTSFNATPGQVSPGGAVLLSWTTRLAAQVSLSDGQQSHAVAASGSESVSPAATTQYTLTATDAAGKSVTARTAARVLVPARIDSFTATPASIAQGDSASLQWSGTASSWSISDGAHTALLGPRTQLSVEPAQDTIYTLTGGGSSAQVTVHVSPNPAQTLSYSAPASGGPLQLVADACTAPCTLLALHLVAAQATALRGVALNLPLDAGKVQLSGFAVNALVIADANPLGGAVLGAGPLAGVLVLGAAKKGTGSAPAQDAPLNAGDEVAHFSLALAAGAGKGVIFDGAQIASDSRFAAAVQSSTGRALNAIAIGRLEAR